MRQGGQGPQPQSGERKPTVRPRSRQRNVAAKARAQPKSVTPDLIGRGEVNLSRLPLTFSPASVVSSLASKSYPSLPPSLSPDACNLPRRERG